MNPITTKSSSIRDIPNSQASGAPPSYRDSGLRHVVAVPESQTFSLPPYEQIKVLPPEGAFEEPEPPSDRLIEESAEREVSSHLLWSKKVLNEMVIKHKEQMYAYELSIKTFYELRKQYEKCTPCPSNAVIDSVGIVPAMWNTGGFEWPPPFTELKYDIKVPHSDIVKQCHKCRGMGTLKCPKCTGSGRLGTISAEQTSNSGLCNSCHGKGETTCPLCIGFRNLLYRQMIHTKFKKIETTYIQETHSSDLLPHRKISESEGDVIYHDCTAFHQKTQHLGRSLVEPLDTRSWCVTEFVAKNLAMKSGGILQSHQNQMSRKNSLFRSNVGEYQERLVYQTQRVKQVPVCMVEYEYNDQRKLVFITGTDNKAWFHEYPVKCCAC